MGSVGQRKSDRHHTNIIKTNHVCGKKYQSGAWPNASCRDVPSVLRDKPTDGRTHIIYDDIFLQALGATKQIRKLFVTLQRASPDEKELPLYQRFNVNVKSTKVSIKVHFSNVIFNKMYIFSNHPRKLFQITKPLSPFIPWWASYRPWFRWRRLSLIAEGFTEPFIGDIAVPNWVRRNGSSL